MPLATGENGGLVIRARLALSPAFAVTARDTLVRDDFHIPARNGHPMFDVSADGRLLLVRRESASARVSVALGWLGEVLASGAR